ncbi:MAG: hypothetical protein J6Y01_09090, partial [Spirochaetales bacterium]|nr:hypothetical protein [Spirochaetales bacterium]
MDCKIKPSDDKPFLGRNIFFIHTNDMIHNGLVMPVLHAEYQVYEIDSEDDVLSAVKKFPDAVLFFCLANTKPEFSFANHAKLIDKVYKISGRNTLRVGIICDTDSTSLRRAALYNAGINCVLAPLSKGNDVVLKNIKKCLNLIGAKGIRKFVRAICDEEDNARVTFTIADQTKTGNIMDVSSVGFSTVFDQDPELQPNTTIQDVVMNIRGIDIAIPSRVFGVRQINNNKGSVKLYIMIFDENVAVDKSP